MNVHSYFLLGLGLTLAVVAGQLGTLAGSRATGVQEPHGVPLRRSTAMLAVALAGQAAACLANPWGARLALLPVQTLLYVHAHGLNRASPPGVEAHPWAYFTALPADDDVARRVPSCSSSSARCRRRRDPWGRPARQAGHRVESSTWSPPHEGLTAQPGQPFLGVLVQRRSHGPPGSRWRGPAVLRG